MLNQSLLYSKPGDKLKVKSISGGEKLKHKLARLGIKAGSYIESKNCSSCNCIIKVENNKIAIGAGMASKIIVEEDYDETCRYK